MRGLHLLPQLSIDRSVSQDSLALEGLEACGHPSSIFWGQKRSDAAGPVGFPHKHCGLQWEKELLCFDAFPRPYGKK